MATKIPPKNPMKPRGSEEKIDLPKAQRMLPVSKPPMDNEGYTYKGRGSGYNVKMGEKSFSKKHKN